MPCCGRPNNAAQKNAKAYHERYAYLTGAQRRQQQAEATKCKACNALTMGDPCAVCGNPKENKEEG